MSEIVKHSYERIAKLHAFLDQHPDVRARLSIHGKISHAVLYAKASAIGLRWRPGEHQWRFDRKITDAAERAKRRAKREAKRVQSNNGANGHDEAAEVLEFLNSRAGKTVSTTRNVGKPLAKDDPTWPADDQDAEYETVKSYVRKRPAQKKASVASKAFGKDTAIIRVMAHKDNIDEFVARIIELAEAENLYVPEDSISRKHDNYGDGDWQRVYFKAVMR